MLPSVIFYISGHGFGHAVRQMYLLCAATDMARAGDPQMRPALEKLWRDLVERKMYVTGGVGARHDGEAFGEPYELPNDSAYAETCAGIGSALWNHRMNLLTADAKYADVLERILYNGFLSGVSLSGDAFFYPNPLECDMQFKFNHGSLERQPWFGTSCCPTNVVRFMPSIAGYVYAVRDRDLYVNLYQDSEASIDIDGDVARLVACVVDDGERVDAASGAVVASGVGTVEWRAAMRRVDGEWLLAERLENQRWEGVAGCASE